MKNNNFGETAQNGLKSFLLNKPMWVFWIVHIILSGILFGVFYTVMYLVAQLWWVPVIIIIGIGMMWGTFAYSKNPNKKEEAEQK